MHLYVRFVTSKKERGMVRFLTSGSGHIGSVNFLTSLGFITSMRTSWPTLTILPLDIDPEISKLSTAWSFFLASFMTVSGVESRDAGFHADRSASNRASGEIRIVISLFELDWMR